jgi:hypothetical protein
VNRRKSVLGLISAVATGLSIGSLSRSRTASAALQNIVKVSPVYFKTSKSPSFRKIAVRFDISGTRSTITLGAASCGGEQFTLLTSNTVMDSAMNMTFVSATYVPKMPPAGDSPVKSGGLADMTFSITIDNVMSNPNSQGPVIDIDPCATR